MQARENHQPPLARLWPYALALALGGTLLLILSLIWNVRQQIQGANTLVLTMARATLEKDVLYRRWNAMHGGVYVPLTTQTPANPYLKVPEREITTPSGRRLTKVNPAYMTRQVHELGSLTTKIHGHITSLKPIRPGNAPDSWERQALLQAEKGATEVYARVPGEQGPILRLLRPLYVEKSCMPCHAQQGYQVGQVRGGLSVSVPLGPIMAQRNQEIMTLGLSHALLWVLGMLFLWWGERHLAKRIRERDQARQELRILSGLLPICSHCKKIRVNEEQWEPMESYIARHSEADFSHGLCPDCVTKYFPKQSHNGPSGPDSQGQ